MNTDKLTVSEVRIGNLHYRAAFELRYSIFFKPFDLAKDVTADELESVSTHIVVTERNQVIAYGRLSPLRKDEYRISQIVVTPTQRRRGISKILLKRLEVEGRRRGAALLRLNAQLTAVGLYEIFGFKQTGEPYTVKLTGVDHIKMFKELDPNV